MVKKKMRSSTTEQMDIMKVKGKTQFLKAARSNSNFLVLTAATKPWLRRCFLAVWEIKIRIIIII